MRFKEGDRVTSHRTGRGGVVKAAFMHAFDEEDFEYATVIGDDQAIYTYLASALDHEVKRFYIEGDMCPGSAGDVPVVLAGPQGMIKNFTERMEDYFEADYDPTRGDNYHVTITVDLQRGD